MTMGKFISNLFLGALAIGLSIFTASRTLDLLAWALPAGQVVYQWLGLCAFEGGMYFWSLYFLYGAKGTPQRSISVCMAVASIVAVAIATIADLSLQAGEAGKIAPLPAAAQQGVIIFLGGWIALNVAAFLACKLMSVEALRAIKEGQAEDRIYAEGLRAIDALAPSIASQAAPYLAEAWARRTWDRIVPGARGRTEYLGPAPAAPSALPAPAKKRRNPLAFLGLGGKSEPEQVSLARMGEQGEEWERERAEQERTARLRAAIGASYGKFYTSSASQVAATRRARRMARLRNVTDVRPEPQTEEMPARASVANGAGDKRGGPRKKN